MSALYPWQFIFILIVLSVLEPPVVMQAILQLLDLPIEISDDVFVLTDVQGH
jgi:hypothetical protein